MNAQTDSQYTVTLDDDPMVSKMISQIMKVPSLPFVSSKSLLDQAASYSPIGVFLDIDLGEMESGLDSIQSLKKTWPDIPLIVITSNISKGWIVDALALGADDFIKKPLDSEELIARFDARSRHLTSRNEEELEIGDVHLKTIVRKLQGPQGDIFLTPHESNILRHLIDAHGVVPRDVLKRICWDSINVQDNALNRHISGLRNALTTVSQKVTLKAAYKKGYYLDIAG